MNYSLTKAHGPVPLLSICCITYNHASFIREAINSFLAQQTYFPIELIIHDDASTDGTSDIVRYYQEKHPALIKAILQSENQYATRGFSFFVDVLGQAQGKYIALCEGDDYWTDPLKLQKQVDFLEANPEFSICFHKVQILEDGEIKEDARMSVPSQVSTIDDLARENYIHTASCVFRHNKLRSMGPNFSKSPAGDYYLHMMNAQHGKIFHLDSIMSVYRIHDSSIWSRLDPIEASIKLLATRKCILQDLEGDQLRAKDILIDQCINQAIGSQGLECKEISSQLVLYDSREYVNRLIERLAAAMHEIDELNTLPKSPKLRYPLKLASRLKYKALRFLGKS